jgi:hypothetical protein
MTNVRFSVAYRTRLVGLVFFLAVAGCSRSSNASDDPGVKGFEPVAAGELGAQIASYDVIVGQPQRLMIGLIDGADGLVGFGNVNVDFAYVADGTKAIDNAVVSVSTQAMYRLVAGQTASSDQRGPRTISPTEGLGVYEAPATFDRAGVWLAEVTATINGQTRSAQAVFDVRKAPIFPYPGQPAPLTMNRLMGSTEVPASAIDSRASEDLAPPDPKLHAVTIASAIEAKRGVMVVVSTPTFCQSRFCGPITDSVERLADEYGDQMDFIHLEVWNDFDAGAANRDAAEWIVRKGHEAREPWVFVVGPDGIITHRFDNIATDAELLDAITTTLKAKP